MSASRLRTLSLHTSPSRRNNSNYPFQVHVYELTQHDDKYDLRYRLKDKIYLPSAAPSTSPTAPAPMPVTASGLSTPSSRAGERKEDVRHTGSSRQSHRGGGGGAAGSSDGAGGSRDKDGGAGQARRGDPATSAFLLVTWSNVVLCEGRVLQLYDFSGTKVTAQASKAPNKRYW